MDIRKDCLAYWKVPNEMRKRPEYMKPHFAFPNMIAEEPNAVAMNDLTFKVSDPRGKHNEGEREFVVQERSTGKRVPNEDVYDNFS